LLERALLWQIGAANELCKTVLFGSKFEPIFVLILKNPVSWLYSLHDSLMLGCEYSSEARKYIELMGAGLQRHLPMCRLQNELLTLSVGRTFKSEHQTEPNTLTVPILADKLKPKKFLSRNNQQMSRHSTLFPVNSLQLILLIS
jgi:hypothetical protein